MSNRTKNALYSLVLLIAILAVWYYRNDKDRIDPIHIEGQTMGTTYHITYFDPLNRNFKIPVDSLLKVINKSINTYDPSSEVSRFNLAERGIAVDLPYLLPPLEKSLEVFKASGGAFDPTVMPLVNAWGFGPGKRTDPDQVRIDSIMEYVGFDKILLTRDSVRKTQPQIQLDFGGIGQGYGADVIADYLKSKGIGNMLVEVGGEGMACGKNLKSGKPWSIGILDPNSTRENQFFKAYISLSDRSFTTSGNYFNYHEVDGVKYSHTISPHTGRPVRNAILSASVFSDDCATADAWGTAFMVMGHEKAIETLNLHPELDAFLIYSNSQGVMETFVTKGIQSSLTVEPNPPTQ